jgi:hypothetical protein
MSAKAKKHYFINDMKQRVTVTVSNEPRGVVATTIVEHIQTDSSGYTTTVHAVFLDYFNRSLIADRLKRVTAKVVHNWNQQLDSIYQMNLPKIQEMYPNS